MLQPKKDDVKKEVKKLRAPSVKPGGVTYYIRQPNPGPTPRTPSEPPLITYDDLDENGSRDDERIIREDERRRRGG